MSNDEHEMIPAAEQQVSIPPEIASTIGTIIDQMMTPILRGMMTMIQQNTKAMQAIAEQQAAQSRKMDELEKEIRWAVPVTPTQTKYINDAIRQRSRELLDQFKVNDAQAVAKLARIIRKAVMSRYGVNSVREIPKCEYPVAIKAAQSWADVFQIRTVANESRKEATGND